MSRPILATGASQIGHEQPQVGWRGDTRGNANAGLAARLDVRPRFRQMRVRRNRLLRPRGRLAPADSSRSLFSPETLEAGLCFATKALPSRGPWLASGSATEGWPDDATRSPASRIRNAPDSGVSAHGSLRTNAWSPERSYAASRRRTQSNCRPCRSDVDGRDGTGVELPRVRRSSGFLDDVYVCARCDARTFGFELAGPAAGYYKFPATIGATAAAPPEVIVGVGAAVDEHFRSRAKSRGDLVFRAVIGGHHAWFVPVPHPAARGLRSQTRRLAARMTGRWIREIFDNGAPSERPPVRGFWSQAQSLRPDEHLPHIRTPPLLRSGSSRTSRSSV